MDRPEMERHLSEITGTLRKWQAMTPAEQAFAHLSGEGLDNNFILHLERYASALQDHLKYENPTWITPDK